MANVFGRQVVAALTNKSGGSVIAGDVVIIDTGNNDAFTTTTSASYTGALGVAQETIANNATGRVLTAGYAALVNVNASVTRGNFGTTHTVAKQATDAGASRVVGAFCQFLKGGTTPDAVLFGFPDASSATGNMATDALWDAKGDLAAGTGANTGAKLTVGADDTILMADAAQSTGLKWVGSQTPSTQAFSDAAAQGTADTYARGDHKHGMPASPSGLLAVVAYATTGDNSYAITATSDADVDATNLIITFTAPASGNVVCRWSALATDGAQNAHWTVRESTTTLADAYMSSAINKAFRMNGTFYITGISAGSHTYKFGAYTGAGTHTIYQGTTVSKFGKIVMEVWSAP